MTVWDTLAAVRRHWYVAVVGVLCTVLALHAIETRTPVFYSRVDVRFLAPVSTLYPNALQSGSTSLVVTAGIVAKRVNGTYTPTRFSSREATLVGRGTWDGTQVSLVDNGVQWSPNFNEPTLDVQVAAPTPELVRERQTALLERIADELRAVQDEYAVPENNRITAKVVPGVPGVVAMRGRPMQAQAMTILLGLGTTLSVIGLFELRTARRRGLVVGPVRALAEVGPER